MNNNVMQSFHQTFNQNHTANRTYQYGQQVTLEKKKTPTSKVLPRRAILEEHGFRQQNGKIIPYPQGFNVISRVRFSLTKNDFIKLPPQEQNFLPWSADINSVVRIFFSRLPAQMRETVSNQFAKPTAIYFTEVLQCQRFLEFLKFRSLKIDGGLFLKTKKLYLQKSLDIIMRNYSMNLHKYAEHIENMKKIKNQKVAQCQEITKYDETQYRKLLKQLLEVAKLKKENQLREIKRQKCEKMKKYAQFFVKLQKEQVHIVAKIWKEECELNLQLEEEMEREEQEQLFRAQREEEERLREEAQRQPSIKSSVKVSVKEPSHPKIHEKFHPPMFLDNFKLILDPRIVVIHPVLRLQFHNKASERGDAVFHGNALYAQGAPLDVLVQLHHDQTWTMVSSIKIENYQMFDYLEFSLYDEAPDVLDKQLQQAQGLDAREVFLRISRKLINGQMSMLDLMKNLHGSRRHYAKLSISADLQRQYEFVNSPMLQFDVGDQKVYNYLSDNMVHQDAVRIISNPITINDFETCKFTNNWVQFRENLLNDALLVRGQNIANHQHSLEYLNHALEAIHLQDYQLEEYPINLTNSVTQKFFYAWHRYGDSQITEYIKRATLRGLTLHDRLMLLPILVNGQQIIEQLTLKYHCAYRQGHFTNDLTHGKELPKEEVQIFIDSIRFHPDVWSDQVRKRYEGYVPDIAKLKLLTDLPLELILRVIDTFNQEGLDYLDASLLLLLSIDIRYAFPQCDLEFIDTSIEALFYNDITSFFSEMNEDLWLRVLDLYLGFYDQRAKFTAAVIAGVMSNIDLSSIKSREQLRVQIRIQYFAGDIERIINSIYDHLNNDKDVSQINNPISEFVRLVGGQSLDQIIHDQSKFDIYQDQIEELVLEVPDEHEDSIYRDNHVVPQTNAVLENQQFVHKPLPIKIHLLIHQYNIHQVNSDEVRVTLQYKDQSSDQMYSEFNFKPNSWLINLKIGTCTKVIDIRNYQFNQIHKSFELLTDSYTNERHYFVSDIEFSILITASEIQQPTITSNDNAIKHFLSLLSSGISHSAFQNHEVWKRSSIANYSDFKYLIQKYFQINASVFPMQELYTQFKSQNFYFVDFLLQYAMETSQFYEVATLFSQSCQRDAMHLQDLKSCLNGLYSQRQFPANDHTKQSRFIKVILTNQDQEIIADVTKQFNLYLQNHYRKHASYDILLFDFDSRLHIPLDLPLLTGIVTLRIKYESDIKRKLTFTLNSDLYLLNKIPDNISDVQSLLLQNARILPLQPKYLVYDFPRYVSGLPLFKTINQHSNLTQMAYLRYKNGAKQLVPCEIINLIQNAKGPKYLTVNAKGKQFIVYREEIFSFKPLDMKEVDAVKKPWK